MALNEQMFDEKMAKLNISKESIENSSSWCTLWRSEARQLVAYWEAFFTRANQEKRLCMIYLANDVLQTSRKKGPEFVNEFYKVLPRALRHFLAKADDKSKASVKKVVKVWQARKVFGSSGAKTVLDELIAESSDGKSSHHDHVSQTKKPSSLSKSKSSTAKATTTAIPPSLLTAANFVTAAETAAVESNELAHQAAAVAHTGAAQMSVEEMKASRDVFTNYIAALQCEIAQRKAAQIALREAADGQAAALSHALQSLQMYQAKVEALEQAEAAIPGASTPVALAGAGGVDAAEAAALAAQLMQNPQALMDAIAATMPSPGDYGGGGGFGDVGLGGGGDDDEYDPENF